MAHTKEQPTLDRMGYYRVSPEVYKRLQDLAELDERPVSYVVRLAIEQYLNRRKAA